MCYDSVRKIEYMTGGSFMNYLLQKVFERRGYTEEFLKDINSCNHPSPMDTEKLCERLHEYFETQKEITLLTDFDMDGIMSGVIGYSGLAELGFNVNLFIPSVTEGYGFNSATIDKLLSDYPSTMAILTADVGITAYEGIEYGKANQIEMLITDHHKGSPSPNASIVVDPCSDMDNVGYDGMCGAHVLYHVLSQYAKKYQPEKSHAIERLRVFAGFGTISDSMPMAYENRPLVKDAVDICRMIYAEGTRDIVDRLEGCDVYRRAFLGLFHLFCCFRESDKLSSTDSITEDFIGYYVAPTFNSIKRMDADLHLAYDVFFGAEPKETMAKLFELNERRKELIDVSYMLMMSQQQPYAPYIYITDAKAGICGLLAQKLMHETGEPIFVLRRLDDGGYSGSGRCPSWFPFLDTFKTLEDDENALPWEAAGHNLAFGIHFNDLDGIETLYSILEYKIDEMRPDESLLKVAPDFIVSMFENEEADCGIDLQMFDGYLTELNYYRPFGPQFTEPEGVIHLNPKACVFSVIGKEKNHLKIQLPYGLVIMCFNQADQIDWSHGFTGTNWTDDMPSRMSIFGKFNRNTYNGVETIQFLGNIEE